MQTHMSELTLIVFRDGDILTVDLRDANGSHIREFKTTPDLLHIDEIRLAFSFAVVDVIEQSEYVTPAGWHHVMQHGGRGWSTYLPGDDYRRVSWFETREQAEREADASSG